MAATCFTGAAAQWVHFLPKLAVLFRQARRDVGDEVMPEFAHAGNALCAREP